MKNVTIKILAVALLISLLGILSIYSSTYNKEGELWENIYQRQMIWVVLGIFAFVFMSNFNYRRIWDFIYLLYGISVFLLLLVFILGIVRLGAQRWIRLSWFNFQPSEFAKLITVLFLAKYFSRKTADDVYLRASRFGFMRAFLLPFIFVAVPIAFIVEQPDFGSGTIIFLIFFVMLYMSNIKLRYLLVVMALLCLAAPVIWDFLREYQKERILVFLNPNIDPLGAGYTVIQSKIAIGSGGFFGKGWLSGTQSQLHFLPESHTDFIFATFAEEWGLLGSLVLVTLYLILIMQGLDIARKTADPFGKFSALGISLMLCIQIFVNIAMNLGFAPVVGLPLPLMSYGGSSVFVTFLSLGILANINRTRAVF